MGTSEWRLLANIVFVVHLLVIGELIGGAVLISSGVASNWPLFRAFHATFVGVVIVSQVIFLGCPLVSLEYALRHQYNPDAPQVASFTVFLIQKIFGVTVPQILVGIATYFIGALAIGGMVFFRKH